VFMKPILFDFPMPIITPHLILKPPQIGDGDILNQAILESWQELHRFMAWAREKPSIDDSEEQVRLAVENWILKKNDEPYLPLFIFEKLTGQFVGATGYHHYDWTVPCIETGYWLRKSYSSRGFMTEAQNAITQYAFKQLGVKRISITCDADNERSKKIPERLGYVLEGTLKNNRRKPVTSELSDTLIYARYDLNDLPDLSVKWGEE
jgi:ribosomal-protein-serine acetyltransferase